MMKWLSNRYAYPLVVLAITVSFVLQLAWLNQLFVAQRKQLKVDLEQVVMNAAKMSTYLSVAEGHEGNENFKKFFLSSDWLQFSHAYQNMRFNQVATHLRSDFKGDSTIVDIRLRFANGKSNHKPIQRRITVDDGTTLEKELALDNVALKRMDSLVHHLLNQAGIAVKADSVVYSYNKETLSSRLSKEDILKAAFTSKQYAYNFIFFRTYQLAVPSLTWAVLYRMRYYILSSCFMLLLTGAVFVFILRLMHNQRLYTQARVSFTSNMTHELKTPVSTVALALESIIENHLEDKPEILRNYLEISRDEIKRLNLMIDKVLNLEQLDNSEARLRSELYDVQHGLQEVVIAMKLQIDNAGATIDLQPISAPCFVYADPVHLTNVFYNLIENAIKYGGKGVNIKLSCTCGPDEVLISFKDSGPGIASIYQNRVFDRYFRVPAITPDTHNIQGSGLGLNYVKNILEKQGGFILLTSEPGEGSNFIIHLPAA
ncbi:signal transduction histidine kinase [Pedobacter cryoconitis]|uniref:sensor histidine kinase n=1 Tax=Pedobacter cryoconitis TaxID=188932 RepID=UPI00161ACE16|nr:HAMP domain-containing sensor histidine kinase [Pedobacter cryoconitis]MBB6271086.1 signal transduction histidine kinase [Pedobacter cryoconitis]